MNVAYFLTPKSDVAWVAANATVDETIDSMRRSGHATLPVLLEDGRYLGTVAEAALLTELLRAEVHHQGSPRQEPLASLPIDHAAPTLGIEASLESVLLRVVCHSFLAVVDDRGVFIGIVRRRDVLRHFADLLVPAPARGRVLALPG